MICLPPIAISMTSSTSCTLIPYLAMASRSMSISRYAAPITRSAITEDGSILGYFPEILFHLETSLFKVLQTVSPDFESHRRPHPSLQHDQSTSDRLQLGSSRCTGDRGRLDDLVPDVVHGFNLRPPIPDRLTCLWIESLAGRFEGRSCTQVTTVIIVSIIEMGAGSRALSTRPIFPATVSISGIALIARFC